METILKPRLTVAHLALVRGWVSGLNLSDLSERYLAALGDDDGCIDLRVSKGTLIRVLDELANIARNNNIPGAVALKRQASRIRIYSGAPTLEDFASTLECPDFYSEAELIELYTKKYKNSVNKGAQSEARRSRLISRQMNLITDLSNYVCSPISNNDFIDLWFDESISSRLVKSGLKTINDLGFSIISNSHKWFENIDGIGVEKAKRIESFLYSNSGLMDGIKHINKNIDVAKENFKSIILQKEFQPSLSIDNNAIQFNKSTIEISSFKTECSISANNDIDALNIWLSLKSSPKTILLYRREIERLIIWSAKIKSKNLRQLTIEDTLEYREFLQAVPSQWICKRGTTQDDINWSPFAGSLSLRSIQKTLTISQAFFNWLISCNYCVVNPFSGVKAKIQTQSPVKTSTNSQDQTSLIAHIEKRQTTVTRMLPVACINAVESELDRMRLIDPSVAIRSDFVFYFALSTGLRISEICAARIGHIQKIDDLANGSGGWSISILGKGNKLRDVALSDDLIRKLSIYLQHRELDPVILNNDHGVFLVGKNFQTLKKDESNKDGVYVQTIHRILTKLFDKSADSLDINDSQEYQKLKSASAHWLRHTCATNAVASEVPLDVVASIFGHSSLNTTSKYIHTGHTRKLIEMNKYWQKNEL